MSSSAMPKRACRSFSSFRICAWMVTSSAVVGSSAIRSVGLVGERHRDHHALALPARELMRIGVEASLRLAQARPDAAARPRAPAPPSRLMLLCRNSVSVICFSMVWSGLSEVIGSWNTMAMRLPRMSRKTCSRRADQFLCRRTDAARRVRGSRRDRAEAAGSTAPSPICPSPTRRPAPRSRRVEVEGHAAHGLDAPVARLRR